MIHAINPRTAVLFEEHCQDIYRKTDRLFAWFLPAQWAAAVACAVWISPKVWVGTTSYGHPHVLAAVLFGGIITALPSFLAFTRPGKKETRYLVAMSQMLIGALLIHLTGGRPETHFHVFGSLAILAFYRDWKVLVPAIVVVVLDHSIRGTFWPQSVFGVIVPQPWRWVEHAGWVVFESIFLISSCLRSQKEMLEIAYGRARHEKGRELIMEEVKSRTRELEDSRFAALNMMQDAEEARTKAEATALELKTEMSERKRIENQLIQSQKMETVGTLAGGIAHDLNNQLTPVKGYIDMILSDTPPDHPNYPLLQEANSAVERCAEVVQRLLGFSRSSNQTKTTLSVEKMFQNLKGLVSKFLPSTISIEMVCPKDIYPIEGNETELGTVLMNLAANARDAMQDGGNLRFGATNVELSGPGSEEHRRSGPFVLLTVSDSGTGIPPDILKRIFEPFFTTKAKGQGTGLGLAMVFKIIHEYGGWIDVSTHVGEGTTFQIYIPGKPGAVLTAAKKTAETDLTGLMAKGENILFADDEDIIRKMGQMLLEKLGYKVRVCSDAQEVVDVYARSHADIDLVLTDMTMPKLSGKQMIEKMLAINPKARIIIASGYASEGNHKDILKMGVADFVQKPYTMLSLAKSLRTVLAT